MNNQEAKFILQGYRPNGGDAGDPTFAAALEQAKNDPALAAWFAREQALDAALSDKLAQIAPPADLRTAILAGSRMTAASTRRRPWWNQPLWLGVAASVAVFLGATLALRPNEAEAFDNFLVADALNGNTHHGDHGEMTAALVKAWGEPTMKLGQKLPVSFASLHETGCRVVGFEKRDLVELCFKRNGVWFHCYVAKASDFPRLAMSSTPAFVDKGNICLASWTDRENVIVVVSKTGRKNLEGLL